jgi:hypothetical protein
MLNNKIWHILPVHKKSQTFKMADANQKIEDAARRAAQTQTTIGWNIHVFSGVKP